VSATLQQTLAQTVTPRGAMALRDVLEPFFAGGQFRIIKPGDGSFLSFGTQTWHPVSVLAMRGRDVYAPFVLSIRNNLGVLQWLRREIEACGFQLISVQPTDRMKETLLKRWKAPQSTENIGGVDFDVWRIPRKAAQ
jgi:hypothetical protein